jgi:hypothetical protein
MPDQNHAKRQGKVGLDAEYAFLIRSSQYAGTTVTTRLKIISFRKGTIYGSTLNTRFCFLQTHDRP